MSELRKTNAGYIDPIERAFDTLAGYFLTSEELRGRRAAMWRACIENPADNNLRLMWADTLQEWAESCGYAEVWREPAELVAEAAKLSIEIGNEPLCPLCSGSGKRGDLTCECGRGAKLARLGAIDRAPIRISEGKYGLVTGRDIMARSSLVGWFKSTITRGGGTAALGMDYRSWVAHGPRYVLDNPIQFVYVSGMTPQRSTRSPDVARVPEYDEAGELTGRTVPFYDSRSNEGRLTWHAGPPVTEFAWARVQPVPYRPDQIPSEWFACMMGRHQTNEFGGATEPYEALGHAALEWARAEAGLPSLDPRTFETSPNDHRLMSQVLAMHSLGG